MSIREFNTGGSINMANQIKTQDSPFPYLNINVFPKSHINIKDQAKCLTCENKPCTYFCPTRVYSFENDSINVDYSRCIECGACPFGCPLDNIDWHFPPGGYGVIYEING